MSSRTLHLLQLSQEEELAAIPDVDTENESSVVELVQAKQEADSNTDYLDQAEDVQAEVSDIKEAAEVVNAKGGISQEALPFFNLAIERICRKLGIERSKQFPTLESYAKENRVKISIEEIEDINSRIEQGISQLKAGSRESLLRLLDALSVSVPEAQKKVERLIDRAKAAINNTERPDTKDMCVVFGDGLNIALSVDGQVPDSLVSYMGNYIQLGQVLCSDYARVAINNGFKATGLPDLFTYSDVNAFNSTIEEAVCGMEDPRTHLSSDQKTLPLPSTQTLFVVDEPESDASQDTEEDLSTEDDNPSEDSQPSRNPKIEWIEKFVNCCQVNSQIHNPHQLKLVEEGQSGYGYKSLCLDDVLSIARQLNRLYCNLNLDELLERNKTLAKDSFEVIDQMEDRFKTAEDKIKVEIEATFNLIIRFVETVIKLAHWPVLNYLTNLVLTSNAFVLYAERSIALPEGAVAQIEPESTEDTETEDSESTDADEDGALSDTEGEDENLDDTDNNDLGDDSASLDDSDDNSEEPSEEDSEDSEEDQESEELEDESEESEEEEPEPTEDESTETEDEDNEEENE